jgi:hypothetical protein
MGISMEIVMGITMAIGQGRGRDLSGKEKRRIHRSKQWVESFVLFY